MGYDFFIMLSSYHIFEGIDMIINRAEYLQSQKDFLLAFSYEKT